jgi:hypothetical protein
VPGWQRGRRIMAPIVLYVRSDDFDGLHLSHSCDVCPRGARHWARMSRHKLVSGSDPTDIPCRGGEPMARCGRGRLNAHPASGLVLLTAG